LVVYIIASLMHGHTDIKYIDCVDDSRPLVTCVLNSHLKGVTIPDAVLIQLSSWRWA